jgi:hypothetical protein
MYKNFSKLLRGFQIFKGCSKDFQGYSEILIPTNKSLTHFYLKILLFISFSVKISTKIFKKFLKIFEMMEVCNTPSRSIYTFFLQNNIAYA